MPPQARNEAVNQHQPRFQGLPAAGHTHHRGSRRCHAPRPVSNTRLTHLSGVWLRCCPNLFRMYSHTSGRVERPALLSRRASVIMSTRGFPPVLPFCKHATARHTTHVHVDRVPLDSVCVMRALGITRQQTWTRGDWTINQSTNPSVLAGDTFDLGCSGTSSPTSHVHVPDACRPRRKSCGLRAQETHPHVHPDRTGPEDQIGPGWAGIEACSLCAD